MNADQIRTHIDSLIKEKNKNYRSLSLAIGKNEAYLHQYINKCSPFRLPEKERHQLAILLDVDEQELTDIELPKSAYFSENKNSVLIEMISSRKNPEKEFDTIGFISFPSSDFARFSASDSKNTKMLRVTGDSMTPTFKDGDYIFFDTSSTSFTFDGLYVIELPNGFQIRRLQQISSSDCAVILDNTNYKSTTVLFKKLKIVGKVTSAFKTEKLI